MKELKNYGGIIVFLLILTVINFMPYGANSVEYVKGADTETEIEVAIN